MLRPLPLILVLATLALGGVASCGETTPAPAADAKAPAVTIVDLQGLDGALASRRGHAVLLNFWAMW
jgi:hypothetical protein